MKIKRYINQRTKEVTERPSSQAAKTAGRKRMKSTLKVGAAFVVLSMLLLAAGCGDKTPIEVRVIYQKTPDQYNGGWCERYPHIVVERTDTGERIMMSNYTLGTTGDVFKVKHCDLRW